MKKLVSFIFAGCLASALFLNLSTVRAEEGSKGNALDGDRAEMKGDHKGGHMGGMKEKLGLTDEQAAKMKDIWKSQQETMKSLRDQEKVDMALLKQKVDSGASDADIKVALDKLSADRKAIQEAQESLAKKIKSILTPTQQAKMLLGMARRMEGPRGGMKDKWKEKKAEWKKNKKESANADDKKGAPDQDDNSK